MAGDDRRSGQARALVFVLGICLAAPLQAAMSQNQKLSYSMGFQLGREVGQSTHLQHLSVSPALFSQGLRDALSGHKPMLTVVEMRHLLRQMAKTRLAALRRQAENNRKQGRIFLAANAKKKGVVTLPSGLQYQVLQKGSGAHPSLKDDVVVNYTATFPDGREFAHGQDTIMQLHALVPGLKQALLLMNQGAHWRIAMPPELAFGAGGPPPVGPERTLVFDLHLVGIKHPPASAAGGAAPGHPNH
ncbi:MAG: FKBP-type peptidyl-prolyl cis-trans isomerase N-terminal domain-containing protein [Acidiferrobacteraceae bacterium]